LEVLVSFLNVWAFWIAAAVVPALLVLYFLKLRRREEWIASTLLWKRAVQDLQVNAPFQRLRKNLLLFLQLLVLAAGVFALARPMVRSSSAAEGRLVIVIDRSGSMNTREGDQTRLDEAKEQAVRLVKTLNRRSRGWLSFLQFSGAAAKTQAMAIAFSDRAAVLSPFTPNTGDLVDIIENIEPTDGRTNIREAIDLAEAYMSPPTRITPGMENVANGTPVSAESAAKVVLFSDGGLADVNDAVLRQGSIDLIRVGQTRDNVGITALRTQRNYERPEILDVFLQVRNFSDRQQSTAVALKIDGVLADSRVRNITLAPAEERGEGQGEGGKGDAQGPGQGESAAGGQGAAAPAAQGAGVSAGDVQDLRFELVLERSAVLEARLSRDDALPLDNAAYAVVPPARKLRVLVVTSNNFFLDSVLSGLPLQERRFVTPGQYESGLKSEFSRDGQSAYDVVIFDKCSVKDLPFGNYMFIGAVPAVEGIEVGERVDELHPLVWWDEGHPVLRHVALDFVYVGKDAVLKMPPEAETLIEGPRGPVLARYARDGRNYLVLSFAVENSTWWQKPSFPVFAYNAIRYLGGADAGEQANVQPGDTLRISLPEGVSEAQLTRPGGERLAVRPDVSGTVYYGGTQQVGIYRVAYQRDGKDRSDAYAVNLEDPWESDIRPRGAAELGSPQIKAGQAISASTPEIWRWFIGAALLVLMVEWYIYNRRVMV
jgi:hypothetical protein